MNLLFASWTGLTMIKAMAMMLQTLHKAGYNEQDILEGSADLHEIVKIYKDILLLPLLSPPLFFFFFVVKYKMILTESP